MQWPDLVLVKHLRREKLWKKEIAEIFEDFVEKYGQDQWECVLRNLLQHLQGLEDDQCLTFVAEVIETGVKLSKKVPHKELSKCPLSFAMMAFKNALSIQHLWIIKELNPKKIFTNVPEIRILDKTRDEETYLWELRQNIEAIFLHRERDNICNELEEKTKLFSVARAINESIQDIDNLADHILINIYRNRSFADYLSLFRLRSLLKNKNTLPEKYAFRDALLLGISLVNPSGMNRRKDLSVYINATCLKRFYPFLCC